MNPKDDFYKNPLYNSYRSIRQVLFNPRNINYPHNGGVGLTMDWNHARDFVADVEAYLGPKPPGMKLARKDHKKNYTLKNLEYAPAITIGRRLSNTIRIRYKGKNLTIKEWSDLLAIPHWTIRQRINRGLPTKQVLHQGKL